MATTTTVIALTPDELATLIRKAVRDEIADMATSRDVLTTDEVAKLLNVHPVVVRRFVRQRGLPAMKIGQTYRFDRAKVLDWIERGGGKGDGYRPA